MDFKQHHPETCLAKSLMIVHTLKRNLKFKNSDELNILIFALRFSRDNFTLGHLEKFCKKYSSRFNWIVDSKIYYDFTKKLRLNKNILLKHKKVNLKLINELLPNPVILYTDLFHLWTQDQSPYYRFHWPHFIVVLSRKNSSYEIIDPATGKKRLIEARILSKSISSLKNHIWISPQAICLIDDSKFKLN